MSELKKFEFFKININWFTFPIDGLKPVTLVKNQTFVITEDKVWVRSKGDEFIQTTIPKETVYMNSALSHDNDTDKHIFTKLT